MILILIGLKAGISIKDKEFLFPNSIIYNSGTYINNYYFNQLSIFKLFLLGNNEKSLRACLNSMTVTYQSNQTLKILEAFAKIKQRTIVLKFDNNVQCTNSFEDIFEPLLNVTDDSVPKIKCKGKINKKKSSL